MTLCVNFKNIEGKSFGTYFSKGGWRTVAKERRTEKERNNIISLLSSLVLARAQFGSSRKGKIMGESVKDRKDKTKMTNYILSTSILIWPSYTIRAKIFEIVLT